MSAIGPLSGICNAPGIPAPHVDVWNEMTSTRRSIPYACDASFRAVQSNNYQVGLISAGFGSADKVRPASAGKSRLDRKTHSLAEVVRRSLQNVPSGGDGCRGWMSNNSNRGQLYRDPAAGRVPRID